MYIRWLLLTWLGAGAIAYPVLRIITQWKRGWLAIICAILPPAGLIVFWLVLGLLAQVSQAVPATLTLLVPGVVADSDSYPKRDALQLRVFKKTA